MVFLLARVCHELCVASFRTHEMLRDCFATIAEKFKDANFYMDPVYYR